MAASRLDRRSCQYLRRLATRSCQYFCDVWQRHVRAAGRLFFGIYGRRGQGWRDGRDHYSRGSGSFDGVRRPARRAPALPATGALTMDALRERAEVLREVWAALTELGGGKLLALLPPWEAYNAPSVRPAASSVAAVMRPGALPSPAASTYSAAAAASSRTAHWELTESLPLLPEREGAPSPASRRGRVRARGAPSLAPLPPLALRHPGSRASLRESPRITESVPPCFPSPQSEKLTLTFRAPRGRQEAQGDGEAAGGSPQGRSANICCQRWS